MKEYKPSPQKPLWKIDRFEELSSEFCVKENQIVDFHVVCSVLPGRSWEMLRRLYGINPVVVPINSDSSFLVPQSKIEIATALDMNEDQFDGELLVARMAWDKWLRENSSPRKHIHKKEPKIKQKKPNPEAISIPVPQNIDPQNEDVSTPVLPQTYHSKKTSDIASTYNLPPLPPEKEALLKKYSFTNTIFNGASSLEDAIAERAWFIDRIDQTQKIFDEALVASLMRQAINNELILRRLDTKIFTEDVGSIKFEDLQKTKKSIEREYREQWSSINALCPWANELQRKVSLTGSFSDIILAVRDWYSDKNNERLNGLHTAYQIQILLRDAEQHPIRFRLGQEMAMLEAMHPDALWDKDWRRRLTPKMCKCLDEGFREGYSKVRELLGIQKPDLLSDDPIKGEYPPLFTPKEEPIEEEPTGKVEVKEN